MSNIPSLDVVLHSATRLVQDVGLFLKTTLYQGPVGSKGKSPADFEAEQRLRHGLYEICPLWGIRGEEEPHLNTQAQTPLGETWLIDPNDGTSAYLKGQRGASISIGLIREGIPILGIVYAYAAPNGKGDLFAWAKGCGPMTRNGRPVHSPWKTFETKGLFFVSNSAHQKKETYREECLPHSFRPAPGIAYRLALCAAGEGNCAISLFHPRDFDCLGGHALLIGVGGDLFDEQGKEIRYCASAPRQFGFAFGGDPKIARSLPTQTQKWLRVLQASKKTHFDPFLKPSLHHLCPYDELLDRLQGAWWGYWIGLWREFLNASSHKAFTTHFNTVLNQATIDLKLVSTDLIKNDYRSMFSSLRSAHLLLPQLREWVKQDGSEALHAKNYILSQLIPFLNQDSPTLLPQDWPHKEGEVSNFKRAPLDSLTEDRISSLLTCYQDYIKLGWQQGRSFWPAHWISRLSAYQHAQRQFWLTDGDWLIESLLTSTYPHLSQPFFEVSS